MNTPFQSNLHRLLVGTCVALAAITAAAGSFKSITIDGSFDDWIGVPLAYEDPADSPTSTDYRKIWLANDEAYFYLRITVDHPEDPFTANDNIFIDADGDASTGFILIVGSEMLLQGGAGYQERDGGFNEGGIDNLDWLSAPAGEGSEFEARISRQALYATDGSPVFQSPLISLLFEAEDANFTRQETAPDGEGLAYEFAEPPPPFTGHSELVALDASWRYRDDGADPGAGWAAPEYDDTAAPWSSGQGLFGYAPDVGIYPGPIRTPLPQGSAARYFRTHFTWNNATAGVVFVATNLLSDGAVVYLNGAEVKRIRMPDGPVTVDTPAASSAAQSAPPGIFALSSGPLVQGDNVLAVEVHQATNSPDDLVFGLSLLASSEFPPAFADPDQPADRGVIAGDATTFSADVIGSGPLQYQWLKDGGPLTDENGPSLTLDPVLAGNAGTYSVRVSNAANLTGVTSRGAVLTVLTSAVAITSQPAPLTVVQGRSAVFQVEATGSAPLSYQWFHDEAAIDGATNADFTLDSVTLADAGEYRVEVSNPAPSSQRSTGARLTVVADTSGPALVSIAGGPGRVALTFNEPLEPGSVTSAANYTVSGGLTVSGAALDSQDPSIVILTVPGQSLGTRYDIAVTGVRDSFGNPIGAGARGSFLSSIQVDGFFDDWAGIDPVTDDPVDAENATDFASVWITSDGDFIYLRVQLHTPSDLGIFYNNIFIDADNSVETGYSFRGIGSDMLIQSGSGYQEKNGGFNEGAIDNLDWRMAPEGVADDFELRFSRKARYSNDGEPVFVGDTIALFLESEDTSFQSVDVAPDVEPILHTLSSVPPSDLGTLGFERTATGIRLSWDNAGRLQATDSLSTPNWQDVASATSPYEAQASGTARFYRLTE